MTGVLSKFSLISPIIVLKEINRFWQLHVVLTSIWSQIYCLTQTTHQNTSHNPNISHARGRWQINCFLHTNGMIKDSGNFNGNCNIWIIFCWDLLCLCGTTESQPQGFSWDSNCWLEVYRQLHVMFDCIIKFPIMKPIIRMEVDWTYRPFLLKLSVREIWQLDLILCKEQFRLKKKLGEINNILCFKRI